MNQMNKKNIYWIKIKDLRLKLILILWQIFVVCVLVVDQVKFVESNTKQNGIWALQQ